MMNSATLQGRVALVMGAGRGLNGTGWAQRLLFDQADRQKQRRVDAVADEV